MITTTVYSNSIITADNYKTDEAIISEKAEVNQSSTSTSSSTQISTYGNDTFESVPEIEHYNNYGNTGVHNGNTNVVVGTTGNVMERCIFSDAIINIFIKPGTEVFVSNANHKLPVIFGSHANYPAVRDIFNQMIKGIQDFITGSIDTDEIEKIIENAYKELLEYNISIGRTDGTDPHYNARILNNVQAHFSNQTMILMMNANWEEGRVYAKENYGLKPGDNFVYYNAKYFFLNKELQDIGLTAISNIAQREGFDFYDAPRAHNYSSLTGNDKCFNFMWSVNLANVKINNTNQTPPKDFVMFYARTLFSQEAWEQGTRVAISIDNPLFNPKNSGSNGWGFHIRVPKGASLFKKMPLWITQNPNHYALYADVKVPVFDLSGYFKSRTADEMLIIVEAFSKLQKGASMSGVEPFWFHLNKGNSQGITLGARQIGMNITEITKFKEGYDFVNELKAFLAEYVIDFDKGTLSITSNGRRSEHDVPFDLKFSNNWDVKGSDLKSAVAHSSFINNFSFNWQPIIVQDSDGNFI